MNFCLFMGPVLGTGIAGLGLPDQGALGGGFAPLSSNVFPVVLPMRGLRSRRHQCPSNRPGTDPLLPSHRTSPKVTDHLPT